ncbi:hypothetical protein Lesp02_22620 [Lentzea sp. NBRC 105346]|nr:hypothetical protein Lesp02_22620 [Lentzea sp. NBRC 105346]
MITRTVAVVMRAAWEETEVVTAAGAVVVVAIVLLLRVRLLSRRRMGDAWIDKLAEKPSKIFSPGY